MDKIIDSLIGAGPLMAIVIAIILVAIALITLANVIKEGFKVLMAIHNQSTHQLRLTRKAVLKASTASSEGLQKVAEIAQNAVTMASKIEENNRADHKAMTDRLTGAETSITNLEASTTELLIPLIAKVDELFDLVNKLKGMSDSSITIEQVTGAMRTSLTTLEANMIQKFTDLANSVGTGPIPSINVEVKTNDRPE